MNQTLALVLFISFCLSGCSASSIFLYCINAQFIKALIPSTCSGVHRIFFTLKLYVESYAPVILDYYFFSQYLGQIPFGLYLALQAL